MKRWFRRLFPPPAPLIDDTEERAEALRQADEGLKRARELEERARPVIEHLRWENQVNNYGRRLQAVYAGRRRA